MNNILCFDEVDKLFNLVLLLLGFYVLYLTNAWTPTLTGIALLLGIGNAFDCVVSFGAYIYLLKKSTYR